LNKLAIGIIAIFGLAGCASSGNQSLKNESAVSVQSKIQKGVTTKEQVRTTFGSPTTVSLSSDGKETWSYALANVKLHGSTFIPFYGLFHSGADTHMKQLVVLFNGDIVEQYTMNDSTTTTTSGWAD
jgi:outer membrane protein assembly factor BamE (lipoprotein component of BamABCDE complex)